ncbi:hypothetical protein EV191_12260 [Tamaricihabitans halophyticus]|uniref:Uncharacterized protein n=1 Tax=Tamaricihabitans halophyticus TaxID=1262583 RepID=A0A4V2SRM9_9PSEU|nr:hypothetical protein [Tamaricihabitans halophyticus]TCP43446.1 hypothetical protein EV191_12260 [Tamaricihabitans halophyticus]
MNTPSAESPRSLDTTDPARAAVLQAATGPLDEVFGDRVRLEVDNVNRIGAWVFVRGTMRDAGGGGPYYAGSSYEARRADGAMSDVYAALLRKTDNTSTDNDARAWQLSDYAIGPTDVAWLPWSNKHSTPRSLFEL